MSEKICLHSVVRGKVQGVWFRASTREQALSLGLCGWVRNLPSGEVEVLAIGPKAKAQALESWLHQGPSKAEVQEVSTEEQELPSVEHLDFKVI